MLSRNANYDMNEALAEIKEKKLVLDFKTKVETQLDFAAFGSKGLSQEEEVSEL